MLKDHALSDGEMVSETEANNAAAACPRFDEQTGKMMISCQLWSHNIVIVNNSVTVYNSSSIYCNSVDCPILPLGCRQSFIICAPDNTLTYYLELTNTASKSSLGIRTTTINNRK